MTVNSTTSRVSYSGNGSTTVFSVPFYFLDQTHLRVILRSSAGVETVQTLTANYTVSGAGISAGGSVTMLVAPASGTTLVISRSVPQTQLVDYQANDPFPANTHEQALDQLTMEVQQLQSQVDRAVKIAETDSTSVVTTLPTSNLRANKALVFDSSGNLTTSLDDFNNAATQAAGFASAASVSASAAATSASAAAATYNTWQGIYYGSLAADPTLDPLGNAINAGDLYYNNVTAKLRVYTGTAWADTGTATPVTITTQTFSGNGSTTSFTLSSAPSSLAATEVYISGVAQTPTTVFSVSGTTLTFTQAPPTGTNNVLVRWVSAIATGVPNDGSVTTAKIQDGAVTSAKIADGTIATADIADGAITSAKIADGTIATADIAAGAVTLAKLDQTGTSGYLLTAQGAGSAPVWAAAPSSGFSNMVAFTTAGTTSWTVPSGVTKAKVTVVGGGGGGGGGNGSATSGAGGGGGGAAVKILTGLNGNGTTTTLSITVGAGGAAGASNATGGSGNTSSIASGSVTIATVSATGGAGGTSGNNQQNGAAGGAGSGGDLNIAGNGGGASNGSHGGGSIFGGGARGVPGPAATAGFSGNAYGGGGSGGAVAGNAGGAGAPGVVIIEY